MNKTRKWLLTALLVMSYGAAWAQALHTADTSPVQLEITDLYGDKQVVPLTDGMTLYWPQCLLETQTGEGAFAVLCDKEGTPVRSIPVNRKDLAHLKFLGASAASTQAQMDTYKNPNVWDTNIRLIFNIGGKEYLVPKPGELHFSSPLGTYELVTATGESYSIPMKETELIQYQDTIQGIGGYLQKIREGNHVYYNSFYDRQYYTCEDFYALIPDGTDYNISMFVPSDEAFSHVPDIISINSRMPRALKFTSNGSIIKAACCRYTFQSGEQGELLPGQFDNFSIGKYMVMMLHSHTILHKDKDGLDSGNEYYLALDGSPIRINEHTGDITSSTISKIVICRKAGNEAGVQYVVKDGTGALEPVESENDIAKILEKIPKTLSFTFNSTSDQTYTAKIDLCNPNEPWSSYGRSYELKPSYDFVAELNMDAGSTIVYNDTINEWNSDINDKDVDLLKGTKVEANAKVINRTPMKLYLDPVAIDVNKKVMSDVKVEVTTESQDAKGYYIPSAIGTDDVKDLKVVITAAEGAMKRLDGLILHVTAETEKSGYTLNSGEKYVLDEATGYDKTVGNKAQIIKIYDLRIGVNGKVTINLDKK